MHAHAQRVTVRRRSRRVVGGVNEQQLELTDAALARAEADGRVLRELAGQAGDRVEAQKDREGALLAAQAIAGDYARQLAALSELQAAHRTADARARGTPLPRGGGGDVLLDSGEPADDGAVDWAAFAAATDYQLGSPGVYPSYSSPALFTR